MGAIRIAWRLPVLVAVLSVTILAAVLGAPAAAGIGYLFGRRRSADHWRSLVFRTSASTVGRIVGMRVEVVGTPPQAPFILVSNHLSYVDVILIGSQIRCVFVSKAEVNGWPLIGPLVRSLGTLFIDRRAKREIPRVVRRIEEVLNSGRGIVFFPEGTTGRGDRVAPFRPSLLEPAARSDRPVHYASVSYRTRRPNPPAEQAICWWGDMKFTPHILQILAMPGFDARLRFGTEPIREGDRKVLATRLHSAVRNQFEAVV